MPNEDFWATRYEDINHFEQHLARNGTLILKFFLNVSKEEQARALPGASGNDPEKHWKFSATDLAEREYWNDYMAAYEECLTATSTPWAPWHIIPADHKWVSRAIVAEIIASAIGSLGLKYPDVTPEKLKQIEESRSRLKREAKGS